MGDIGTRSTRGIRSKEKNTKRMKGKRRRLSVRMKMAKIKSGYEPLYIFMSIYIYIYAYAYTIFCVGVYENNCYICNY